MSVRVNRCFVCRHLLTAVACFFVVIASFPCRAQGVTIPLGSDDAGDLFFGDGASAAKLQQFFGALNELGLNHMDLHLSPITDAGERNALLMGERIRRIDREMRERGLTYTLNVESSNFRASVEITPGVNEFERPGGLHRWDLRMGWLSPILPPGVSTPTAFQGIVYDECDHMQLSNNKYSNSRRDFDQPFLANTHNMDLASAYDRLVSEGRRLREAHYEGRVPLMTEQVWPDLFHVFANAGWDITPKLLKEHLSSVVVSVALGAAIQYADRTHFRVSPDLWRLGRYPGHSAEALRSALLMAYWLGAEGIYVENLSFRGTASRHPDAVTPGSLLHWLDDGRYELTAYGRVLRDFAKQYVPANPRPTTWRDYRPRVAIVRLPDGGWGQTPDRAQEYPSRNRLLGNREHPLDEAASEWLDVWPVLTHGAARPGAIAIFKTSVYPERTDFFLPIHSVAVFDHKVTGPVLDSVECFIVCGHALSPETFQAIRARVEKGATCIIARRLYSKHEKKPLPGDWLVVKSFKDRRIGSKLQRFLGPPNIARFRFERHVVDFEKGPKPDQIQVRVTSRTDH